MLRAEYSGFKNITSATTTLVKAGPGVLVGITVNKAVASGVYTLFDSLTGSGLAIGTITMPAALLASQVYLPYNVQFINGLTVVTSSTDDITVSYL